MGRCLRMMRLLPFFINRTRKARDHMKGRNSTISFDIEDETPFYFHFADGKASLHTGRPAEADATLRADNETFYQIMLGKMSQEEAFDQKLILPEGETVEAIRLRYIMNLVLEKNWTLKFFRSILAGF